MEFMNAELVIYEYLKAHDVKVFVEIPANRPDRFVTIERVGGSARSPVLDQALIAVQCWGTTRLDASQLACQVDALIRNADLDLREVCHVARTGFTHYPDLSGHERYQLLFTLNITV